MPKRCDLAAPVLACYIVTMLQAFSLAAGVGRRLVVAAPLLAALWAFVLWAMA